MYNPLINKKPYGASACGKKTTITFPLEALSGIERVFVVLRKDDDGGNTLRFELQKMVSTQKYTSSQNGASLQSSDNTNEKHELCNNASLQSSNNSTDTHELCNNASLQSSDNSTDTHERFNSASPQSSNNSTDTQELCNNASLQSSNNSTDTHERFNNASLQSSDNSTDTHERFNNAFPQGMDMFEGAFELYESGIWRYRFEGELEDGGIAFFGRSENGDAQRADWLPEWQLSVTKADYKTPNWAKRGVIYQIFADRFCKGEERSFTKRGTLHINWDDRPDVPIDGEDYRADDFFGGNIVGIISKLDYLSSFGVTCVYLSPIFEAASNHRYDTGNYMKIDSLFGDEKQFSKLISEAKLRGMSIMLDGVFNHTGADSVYFNKFGSYDTVGAYQNHKSPYFNWYFFNSFPNDYHCWWGSTVVPTVNKEASGYRNLILGKGGVLEKWTKLGVKGWRLDVVDELPIEFTNELCKKVKSIDKDTLILGEVWEDATTKMSYDELRPYFMGEQLDSVSNYPFKVAIEGYVLSGNIDAFINAVTTILENYPKESLDCLMNVIDTHDTVRALTFFADINVPETVQERAAATLSGENLRNAKRKLMLASTLQFALPGVPCVYYGDEAGAEGYEDPMNRGTYPWGREDLELLAHYRALGKFRAKFQELLQGETHFVRERVFLDETRTMSDGASIGETQSLSESGGQGETHTMSDGAPIGETHFVRESELLVFVRESRGAKLTIYANNTEHSVTREKIYGINALSGEKICRLNLPPCSAVIIES